MSLHPMYKYAQHSKSNYLYCPHLRSHRPL